MKRESMNPPTLHVRVRGGLMGTAQVVTVEQASRQIFLSGQLARAPDGSCVGKGDMRAQIAQVGKNIEIGLAAAGATIDDVVCRRIYVTDMEEYLKHPDLRALFFGKDPPTSTAVEVSRLVHPDFMIEIEVIAMQ
jgi:2-iminobutanoate/2-iminopropanoate deaminase